MRDRNGFVQLLAVAALILIAPARPASAQVTLDLINEYPANSISGEADKFFADAVTRKTDGRVVIHSIADAKSGLRTRDQLKAVSDGKFAMATSFGGALGDESPLFLLSSLPFVSPTDDDARKLFDIAQPLYAQLFAERQQKLLYVVPWPPSGIWSGAALTGADGLKSLKIRTYDKTSTEVLTKVAASATLVSFNDLNAKLETSELNAVLSSGDGGAGRQLWKYLRHFSAVGYATPLSFGSISLQAWSGLDDSARAALEEAGRETSAHQWAALANRVETNYARMRDNGVTIDEHPPADVVAALRGAAKETVSQWFSQLAPDVQKTLGAYPNLKP
jgi:TRAP-type C4-dicarboxylate transport system substrate-binding protein